MQPYNSYNNTPDNSTPNNNTGAAYHSTLVPQQRVPDENGYYHFTPAPQSEGQSYGNKGKDKKKSKTLKYIAVAAAVIMASSASGGATALYILNNSQTAGETSASFTGTVVNAVSSESSSKSPVEAGSVAYVAQIASDSVVEIDTKTEMQSNYFFNNSLAESSGSGVIISDDGYIVTNNHVVEDSNSILVRLSDGTEYDAALIGVDPQTDLAVVKIEATELNPAVFADSDSIQVGDLAVAIGNPLGRLGGTVTNGIISATGREVSIGGGDMTLLQTSAAINPGNSGGGLFDSNGHLIGIVNAKSAGVEIEGLGFAIPSNTVQKISTDIINNGYVSGRPVMGITVTQVSDQRTAMMYGVTKAGVYVVEPGDNDGLQKGDRFVFIDGKSIETSNDISNALRNLTVGDTISITVERDNSAIETQVTLQENLPESVVQKQIEKKDNI